MERTIEKEIQITAVYFKNRGQAKFESYPRRMVVDGREYTFIDSGLRYLIQKGQELVKLFDMTDGQNQFRLRVDSANHWTLVGIKAAN